MRIGDGKGMKGQAVVWSRCINICAATSHFLTSNIAYAGCCKKEGGHHVDGTQLCKIPIQKFAWRII